MRFVFFIFLFFSSKLFAEADEPLPEDVRLYVQKRDSCEHFLGEPRDFDEEYMRSGGEQAEKDLRERVAFLLQMALETCPGLDRQLVMLKERHSGSQDVMSHLNAYSQEIEQHLHEFYEWQGYLLSKSENSRWEQCGKQ